MEVNIEELNQRAEKKLKFQRIVTLVGGVILLMPNGLMWFWGNMASYGLSYIAIVNGDTTNLQAPWATSFFIVGWIGTLLGTNYLCKWVARRWAILLGIVLTNLGAFLSYYAVKGTVMSLSATFGILLGLGTGLLYGNAMQLVLGVAGDDRVGLFSSILQGSFSLGAIISTQLMTWYTNPHNASPDFQIGGTLYFTDSYVLNRVPSMFLVYGTYCLTLHVVSFTLLQFNPSTGRKAEPKSDPERQNLMSLEKIGQNNGQMDCKVVDKHEADVIGKETEAKNHISSIFDDTGVDGNGITSRETIPPPIAAPNSTTINSDTGESTSAPVKEYTPAELLKIPLFYILWICFFFADIPYVLLTNYYKLYGQLWIHNDHFLSYLGTTLVIFSSVMRIFWGMALDKFGVKNCFILLISSLVVVISFYCFTAMINRWLYFIVTLLFGTFGSALYGCFMAATAKLFGKAHISTNYGLILTSSIVFNTMAPFVIGTSITTIGWYYTFLIAGALNTLSLILCVLKIPII